jgi:hypothetical protein
MGINPNSLSLNFGLRVYNQNRMNVFVGYPRDLIGNSSHETKTKVFVNVSYFREIVSSEVFGWEDNII